MPVTGSCHCGKIAFKIEGEIPTSLTRCTCSFCAKRGTLYAYYKPSQFQLTTPKVDSKIYRWNTKTVDHTFCAHCGCGAYSDSPDYQPDGSWDGKTRRIGVNARLIDNFIAADAPVKTIDGKNLW